MLQKRVAFLSALLLLACCLSLAAADSTAYAAEKININTAPAEVLQELNGVGPALAERIVEHRKSHPFQAPQEITQVKGIGQKTYADNKDRIAIE